MNTDYGKFVWIGLLVSVVSGCIIPAKPIYDKPSKNNMSYNVAYLFEHDGCKVYRFEDRGNFVYFTTCIGETNYQQDSARVIRNTTIKRQ